MLLGNISFILVAFSDKLYQDKLVSYLADSFNTGQQIRFENNFDPILLDVSQAVPLGLILNEAVTYSIKYAFPDGRKGIITISLSTATQHHCLLSISDNGIGTPQHFANKKSGSLGMTLIDLPPKNRPFLK